VAGDGWSWPKRVSDAIATVSPGVRVRVARERETSGVGRLDQIPPSWFGSAKWADPNGPSGLIK
jgi:hypothetical protein